MITGTDHEDDTPTVGTPVIVLSMDDGPPYPATVQSWVGTNRGLVVHARVTVTASAVRRLAEHPVWVSVPEHGPGFTVFSGVAHRAEDTVLDITGAVTLVREHRRQHLRGPATGSLSLSSADQVPRQLQVVDLSRGGVRVALYGPTDLDLGEQVTVEVQLEDGAAISARGTVTRVDTVAGHAVVRFDDLASEHGSRIDRFVLLQLTPAA
jgi:PilZ domain